MKVKVLWMWFWYTSHFPHWWVHKEEGARCVYMLWSWGRGVELGTASSRPTASAGPGQTANLHKGKTRADIELLHYCSAWKNLWGSPSTISLFYMFLHKTIINSSFFTAKDNIIYSIHLSVQCIQRHIKYVSIILSSWHAIFQHCLSILFSEWLPTFPMPTFR